MWKVCLQTFRDNRIFLKFAYFLRNLQTSWANNLSVFRIKNAKFSGPCFHINGQLLLPNSRGNKDRADIEAIEIINKKENSSTLDLY